jgi:hypothetical protein
MIIAAGNATAQTVGYAKAFDQFAAACGNDIDKLCKKVNLGGGLVQQCLEQNQASVSANCKATIGDLHIQLQKRAAARAAVMRL